MWWILCSPDTEWSCLFPHILQTSCNNGGIGDHPPRLLWKQTKRTVQHFYTIINMQTNPLNVNSLLKATRKFALQTHTHTLQSKQRSSLSRSSVKEAHMCTEHTKTHRSLIVCTSTTDLCFSVLQSNLSALSCACCIHDGGVGMFVSGLERESSERASRRLYRMSMRCFKRVMKASIGTWGLTCGIASRTNASLLIRLRLRGRSQWCVWEVKKQAL